MARHIEFLSPSGFSFQTEILPWRIEYFPGSLAGSSHNKGHLRPNAMMLRIANEDVAEQRHRCIFSRLRREILGNKGDAVILGNPQRSRASPQRVKEGELRS